MDIDNEMISGKYFLLEKDNRFPLVIPTEDWQNFSNERFNCPKGCSIYLLRANDIYYVGSDGDGNRPNNHKNDFKRKEHGNYHMQNVVNKYGIGVFYYLPILEIPLEYIEYRDQIENSYIRLFDTYHNGYNLCEFADTPTLGKKMSEETKNKLSIINKGKHSSPNTEFVKGLIPWNKNKQFSEESKQKMSNAHKGKHHSLKTEFKKGMITWNKGKSMSEESKKKLSESLKGKTPWNKGIKHSEETKKKISNAIKNKHRREKINII